MKKTFKLHKEYYNHLPHLWLHKLNLIETYEIIVNDINVKRYNYKLPRLENNE